MSFANFKTLVTNIYPIPDQEMEMLFRFFKRKVYKKKSLILQEGQKTKDLFFISSGYLRGYYVKDTEEITLNFYFGPTFYADVVSINEKIPTMYNIEALVECEVYVADINLITDLGEKYSSILLLFLRFYEIIYSFGQKRQLSLIYETAETRYFKLFSERPKVISMIPQIYIASYLGIKPESLSRLRRKITSSNLLPSIASFMKFWITSALISHKELLSII